MSHNSRCDNANSRSKCRCKCGGRFHGSSRDYPTEELAIRSVNTYLGGEVAEFITKYLGQRFKCSCGHYHTILSFLGYKHDGGLSDSSGKKWWVLIECQKCHYQWSFGKIPLRVRHQSQFGFHESTE